jgi:hypothetical protein
MPGRKVARLILVPDYEHHGGEEFATIAEEVRKRAPGLSVRVVDRKRLRKWQFFLVTGKTLIVALRGLGKWQPWRGTLLHGASLTKSEQLERMERAGIEVGLYQKVKPGVSLDSAQWGRVVVIKPEVGKRGREVKVMRTGKVKWEKFSALEGDFLAQEFVYTGEFPVSYRVLTFCGRAMYVQRSINKNAGEALTSIEKPQDFSGKNIVATTRDSVVSLVDNTEIQEFAERIARTVFGEIPSLGIDLLRDCRTGRLVVAEVNPWGQTWHISSELGKGIQETNGIDFRSQFGLEAKAGEALLDLVARHESSLQNN